MILNEFFNLPQVFEKDMNEFDASGYDRYSIYMDNYDLKEKFSDLDDAVEAIEAYKRDDPKSRYADYNVRDLDGKVVWRNDAWQDVPKPGKIQFLPRNDQGVAEGMFGKKKPAEPFEFYLDGCNPHAVKKYLLNKFGSQGWRVAGPGAGTTRVFVAMSPELYPTGNEAKWDIESNCGEQGMAEAKDDYVPPREANYDDKYQAMVRRVGQKAKQQEKAKQQQPKAPVRESRRALLKQIIQS